MKKLLILFAVFLFSCRNEPNTVTVTTTPEMEIINYTNPGDSEKEGTIIYNYKNNTIVIKRDSVYELNGMSRHTMAIRVFTVLPAENKDSIKTIYDEFH